MSKFEEVLSYGLRVRINGKFQPYHDIIGFVVLYELVFGIGGNSVL